MLVVVEMVELVLVVMVLHQHLVILPHGLLLMVLCLPLVVDMVRWVKYLNLPQVLVDLVEVVMERIQIKDLEHL
jgi:hypothetical protein